MICSYCNAAVSGRFCTECGKDSTIATAVMAAGAVGVGYVAPSAAVPAPSMGTTADNRFTDAAQFLLNSTGERIAWQGKPSILSVLPRAVVWAVLILIVGGLFVSLRHPGFAFLLVLFAAIHAGAGYLNWRNTTYRVTSQRIEYSSGVFSCTTAASPLSDIRNVTILRPFPWNLFGLGHLELDIPNQAVRAKQGLRPKVVLRCLEHLEATRDLIHSSSTIVNQAWDQRRFGR